MQRQLSLLCTPIKSKLAAFPHYQTYTLPSCSLPFLNLTCFPIPIMFEKCKPGKYKYTEKSSEWVIARRGVMATTKCLRGHPHFHEYTNSTFSDPLPLKTNILGFQNKDLVQHNIYCATTKINLSKSHHLLRLRCWSAYRPHNLIRQFHLFLLLVSSAKCENLCKIGCWSFSARHSSYWSMWSLVFPVIFWQSLVLLVVLILQVIPLVVSPGDPSIWVFWVNQIDLMHKIWTNCIKNLKITGIITVEPPYHALVLSKCTPCGIA